MQGFWENKLNFLPLLAVLVVIGLLVVALSSDFSSTGEATVSPRESRDIDLTEALLAGIPQHGSVLGNPKAPVTLQFFGDLQCPDSRQVMLGALPFLIRHWVRDGKLRILYRSAKTDTPDWPEFREQQKAALAAGRQGRMWTYIDLFYRQQGPEFSRYADDDFLDGIAEQTGLSLRSWAEDRESDAWAGTIDFDELMAEQKEMGSTPSFLIGPTGGEAHRLLHFSLEETNVFDEAIEELLNRPA